MLLYLICAVVVLGDGIAHFVLARKRRTIGTATEDAQARQQLLKLVQRIMHVHAVAIVAILLFIVGPMLHHA